MVSPRSSNGAKPINQQKGDGKQSMTDELELAPEEDLELFTMLSEAGLTLEEVKAYMNSRKELVN